MAFVKATPDRCTDVAKAPAILRKDLNHPATAGGCLLAGNVSEVAAFHIRLTGLDACERSERDRPLRGNIQLPKRERIQLQPFGPRLLVAIEAVRRKSPNGYRPDVCRSATLWSAHTL